MLILGSGSDPNVLEAAGIHKANVVAAVTGTDETNLVVCSLARLEFQRSTRHCAREQPQKRLALHPGDGGGCRSEPG